MSEAEAAPKVGDYLDDPARLAALHRLDILDSEPEETFDAITRLASTLFGVPIATIHLLDDKRQWVKSATENAYLKETPVEMTACQHVIRDGEALVIPDLAQDPRFCDAEVVTGPGGLRFYAGAPLRNGDGHYIGTLCLMDREPRAPLDGKGIRLLSQLAEVVIGAMELRRAQDQARRHLLRAVEEDAQTGLLSRRGILLRLQRLLGGDLETPPEIAMIKVRLGGIDVVKRGYGTAVSSQIFRNVADRIRLTCVSGELLAALDEGTFLIARVFDGNPRDPAMWSPHAWAEACTRDIVECIERPNEVEGETFHLTASAGVACSPEDGVDAYTLLDVADEASEIAKRDRGNGRIHWGASGQSGKYRHKLSVERRLRTAVERRQFALAYQPIVDLQNGCHTVGAEALLRWPQEDGSVIGPDLFIPLAEELGLIHPLGLWVFETACETLRQWRNDTGKDLWTSVNLSPLQLQDPNLADRLAAIATSAGVDPGRVKLEITESALIERFDETSGLLKQLTEIGFPLALDDFGTGHSSLSRLIHLPFSVLKVDRAFVYDTPDGPGAAVVASLALLAQSLHLEALGEGIEVEAHETFLRGLGYHLGQGYHYAKPLTPEAFLERVHHE